MSKFYISTHFFIIPLLFNFLSKKIDLYLYFTVIPTIFPDTQAPKAISCTL